MSAPNPQANAAAAQPDAQPAIYETDIWAPPPDDGRLHHLHKPMPPTGASSRPSTRAERDTAPLEPDPAPEPEADPDPEVGGWPGWSDQAMLGSATWPRSPRPSREHRELTRS